MANILCFGCINLLNCKKAVKIKLKGCSDKIISVTKCECGFELAKGGYTACKSSRGGYFCLECRSNTNGITTPVAYKGCCVEQNSGRIAQ